MIEKIYRGVFWVGYVMVFAASFIHFKKNLHAITIDIISFQLHFDQVLHTLVYFLICIYFAAGQYIGLNLFREYSLRNFIIAILVLAATTEVVQLGIPYRSFKVFDMAANFAGILLGLGVIWMVNETRNKKFKTNPNP